MFNNEIRLLKAPAKVGASLAVSWAYPNTYEVGMSSLGYQLVWWLLESDPELRVLRAFTDEQESSWESSDLIGFTLSWELDYLHLLNILKKAKVNELSSQRSDSCPLVFGGGPVLSANPEPFADLFDVILLGDAEAVVPAFIQSWKEIAHIAARRDKLRHLAKLPGVYIPSLYDYRLTSPGGTIEAIEPSAGTAPAKVIKQVFSPPADYVAHSAIVSPEAVWANTFLVEVARSCPQECRFCLASYLTRPFRPARVETIMQAIDRALKHTPRIGLLGPSVTEHPEFPMIAELLLERPEVQISIASVRADSLTPLILKMLRDLGQRSVTIALESGSERLRAIMKKNLSESEVMAAVNLVADAGFNRLKFYGMVGLPGEGQEDLEETVRLFTRLKKAHRNLSFKLGLSSFVAKAQTPFQWAGRDKKCQLKLNYLQKHLSRLGVEVRPESHNWSDIQAFLSRADRRITPLLLEIAKEKGNLGSWRKALRNLPPSCPDLDYYAFRTIPLSETLPWSHLTEDLKTGMLTRHWQAAHDLTQQIVS